MYNNTFSRKLIYSLSSTIVLEWVNIRCTNLDYCLNFQYNFTGNFLGPGYKEKDRKSHFGQK